MSVDNIVTETSPEAPARSSFRRKWLLIATIAGLALLSAIILGAFYSPSRDQLVWIDAKEIGRGRYPGWLSQLKYRVMRFSGPVWQLFRRGKHQIHINIAVLTISPEAASQISLGNPLSTKPDGLRAWVLTDDDFVRTERLKNIGGVQIIGQPSVTTLDGMQSQVNVGPVRPGASTITVQMFPKVSAHKIRLSTSFTVTEPLPGSPGQSSGTRTNLASACRVFLPNTGALLVAGPTPTNSGGSAYWIIITTTATDSSGNPVEL